MVLAKKTSKSITAAIQLLSETRVKEKKNNRTLKVYLVDEKWWNDDLKCGLWLTRPMNTQAPLEDVTYV